MPHAETMSIHVVGDRNWRVFDLPVGEFTLRIETITDTPSDPFVDDTTLSVWAGCVDGVPRDLIAFNDDDAFRDTYESRIDGCLVGPIRLWVEVGGYDDVITPADFALEIRFDASDADEDGVVCDNCPELPNPEQVDTDADRFGDDCDACPAIPGYQDDVDLDGRGDACDSCTDVDFDGYGDAGSTSCPLDNCPFVYNPHQETTDFDGDGFLGYCDVCPFAYDPEQLDSDGDRIGDACDFCADTDADGYHDSGFPPLSCPELDNCPLVYNPDQDPTDADRDGVADACDNCPGTENSGQADADSDHEGDACDPCSDIDGDAWGDSLFPPEVCSVDNCASVANPDQTDSDGDGRGDACDACPADPTDSDGDGLDDACDTCPAVRDPSQVDSDQDGEGDACDLDDGSLVLGFVSSTTVAWDMEVGFDAWNIYRLDMSVLRGSGIYTQAPGSNALAALFCGLGTPQLHDPVVPGAGRVAAYLVAGVSGGVEGSLGTDSAGVERPNTNPCP